MTQCVAETWESYTQRGHNTSLDSNSILDLAEVFLSRNIRCLITAIQQQFIL